MGGRRVRSIPNHRVSRSRAARDTARPYGRWYLSNFVSLLAGIAIILALFHLAATHRLRHPTMAIIAIAFVPQVLIDATSTMDYLPALAILVWAYVTMLKRSYAICAILIGIACGFRPSSALFVVPVIAYMLASREPRRLIWETVVVAATIGVLWHAPGLLTFGMPKLLRPGLDLKEMILIGGYRFVNLFGILETVVMAPLLVHAILKHGSGSPPDAIFHYANIGVWTILFALMPLETSYLLPMLPSVVLLFDRFGSTKAFGAVVALTLLGNVVQIDLLAGESGDRHIAPSIQPGLTVMDAEDRRFKLSTRDAVTQFEPTDPTILMFGASWIPTINDAWERQAESDMYRKAGTQFYVSNAITDERELSGFARSYRLLVWTGDQSQFSHGQLTNWQDYVEVIDDLEGFPGASLSG